MALCYSNTVFKELIETYKDWQSLRTYLESESGGNLRIIGYKDSNLCIIRYDKRHYNDAISHIKWFRSVVWDINRNRPVCVAPPRVNADPFPHENMADMDKMVIEEYFDGFMINTFKYADSNALHITSRSRLDASGTFYSSKTFRQMFIEAYIHPYLYSQCDLDNERYLSSCSDFDEPNAQNDEWSIAYSFHVQHTDNRVVSPIHTNRIILIQKTVFYGDGTFTCFDHFNTFRDAPNMTSLCNVSENKVSDWLSELFSLKSWHFQGVVIKDNHGNRWRFRSDKYNAIRLLRGNNASHIARFAQLYTQNLTSTYLEYYPEDAFTFAFHMTYVNTIIKSLYTAYVERYIKKSGRVCPKMYHSHLFAIHNIYLSRLNAISEMDVQLYFHKLPWQRIAFLLKSLQDIYFSQLHAMFS
jgi:hypothetical protein